MGRQRNRETLAPSPGLPLSASLLPLAEPARLRQGIYRLFGALFLYPDQDRLRSLQAVAGELQQADDLWSDLALSDPLRRLLEALSPPFPPRTTEGGKGGVDQGAKVTVEEEYVRLFAVNPAAPPYESSYLDPEGLARGWMAVQLEREYAAAGLTLSPSLREPPDHVAVELEFMSFLCGQEAQSWETEAAARGVQWLERQYGFLDRHLCRWFPAFLRSVNAAGAEHLYALTTEAAHTFIHTDRDQVVRLLEKFLPPCDFR